MLADDYRCQMPMQLIAIVNDACCFIECATVQRARGVGVCVSPGSIRYAQSHVVVSYVNRHVINTVKRTISAHWL